MGRTCDTHGKKEKCIWGLFQKPEGKVLFRIPGLGWMDNIKCISKFNGKPEFFVYRAFIANTEIIILLLFNIVPY